MNVEKFCLKCLREVAWDTTENHWGCDCFAVRTMPDDDGTPQLEYHPPFWIETDIIPKLKELYDACHRNGERLPQEVFEAMVRTQ